MKMEKRIGKSGETGKLGSTRIEATVYSWAHAINIDPKTLTKRLRIADVQYTRRGRISAANIYRALAGDDKQARARRENAQAELFESKLQERLGNLIHKESVQTAMRNFCLPVRQRLNSLAPECAHLCNPSDPVHARRVLDEWVKRALPVIREEKQKLDGAPK